MRPADIKAAAKSVLESRRAPEARRAAAAERSVGREVYDRGVELRSSQELLIWLAEVSADTRCGALKRGEYLLMLAIGERKVAHPAKFADWLYELRDGGMIAFDDWDASSARGPDGTNFSRQDVLLIRNIGVIAAGRALLESAGPR